MIIIVEYFHLQFIFMEKMMKIKRDGTAEFMIFILPALIFYSIFLVTPTIQGLSFSFTNWNGLNKSFKFIGFQNFIEAFTDDKHFLDSVEFTLKYVFVMVLLSNLIALGFALMIDSLAKKQNLFRTLFFIPNMISFLIGAYIWRFIFKKVLKEIAQYPLLGFLDQHWLGNPNFSFWAIVIMSLWTSVGYLMIIYIAALQGVPTVLKEAATIDGANTIQKLRNVVLPLIMHSVTINFFLSLNNSFKAFDQIYGLTGGGPGRATQVMSLNIYEEAFSSYYRFGYASAKAIILFCFVLIITLIQLWITRSREVKA